MSKSTVGWSLPEISSLPEVSTNPESTVVGAADFAPEVLLMKSLLPFMSVEALLFWRVLSTQTRSPQALLNHVSEMGSLERKRASSMLHLFLQCSGKKPSGILNAPS
ncbi:unnamed protein product [Symbiodinium sp. CCMP2592]|nr:unnamed protein product [Symbiodinium sp. CCMP2592]